MWKTIIRELTSESQIHDLGLHDHEPTILERRIENSVVSYANQDISTLDSTVINPELQSDQQTEIPGCYKGPCVVPSRK